MTRAVLMNNEDRSSTDQEVPNGRVCSRIRNLNLTSMLDVTFLLLIFFVLTASFAIREGVLAAELPRIGTHSEASKIDPIMDPIRIRLAGIDSDRVQIHIDGHERINDFEALYALLNTVRYDDSNTTGLYQVDNPIVIESVRDTEWGIAVAAFNACVRAGYLDVRLSELRS